MPGLENPFILASAIAWVWAFAWAVWKLCIDDPPWNQ
jgi:hypothetical protein